MAVCHAPEHHRPDGAPDGVVVELEQKSEDVHHGGIGLPQPALTAIPDLVFGMANPAPDGFVCNAQTACREQRLHVAITQGETEVEPDRMLDHNWRKPMARIRE